MQPDQITTLTPSSSLNPENVVTRMINNLRNRPKLALGLVFGLVWGVIGVTTLLNSFAAPGSLKPQGTYTNWQTANPENVQFTTLDSILAIETDPTTVHPLIGYFWATQFEFASGGGYMGIQTRGNNQSKNALFALFGEAISVENGTNGSVCTVTKSGYDGDPNASGASCNMPLNWQAGDMYRMRLQLATQDATSMTWQVNLVNAKTGQGYILGKIKKPRNMGMLRGYISDWTEYYTPGRAGCDFPYSKIVWGQPTYNADLPNATRATAHQNNIAAGDCVSKISDISGGTRQEIGNPAIIGDILPSLPAGGQYISDLNWTSATTGAGVITKDKSVSNDGSPINLAGKTFAKGYGVHASSQINYNIGGLYSQFVAYVNTQYSAPGKITYEVWADGVKLFDSGAMDGFSYTKAVNVNITGKKELKLVVTDAGDGIYGDWAAWADARLIPTPAPAPASAPASAPAPVPAPAPPTAPGSTTQSPSDTTAPVVSITSPANGATVSYTAPVNATASDNVSVTKVEIYIDGRLMATSTTNSISYTWVSYYAPAGNHTITVKAYDAVGNVGQSSVTVKK